jgi:mRNA-degrading endonuclease RelE of RelBE toxin-antitoxin system
LLADDELRALQALLMENPNAGSVMPGCGGVRKIRFGRSATSSGKRGGVRVLYFVIISRSRIHLLDIYDKSEKEDVSSDDKKALALIAGMIKRDAP